MRLLSVILFCLGLLCVAQAQVPMTGAGLGKPATGGGGAYSGPGDIVSSGWVLWWGLRAFSTAKATGHAALFRACTPADAACADILSNTDGTPNLAGSGLGCDNLVTQCSITKVYDQSGASSCSGACDAVFSVLRANLVTGCIGSLPCLACKIGATSGVGGSPAILGSAVTQPYSISFAANRTSGTAFGDVIASDNGNTQFGSGNVANQILSFAGSLTQVGTFADNAFHAVQIVADNATPANSDIYVDGTANTGNAPGANPNQNFPSMCAATSLANGGNIGGNSYLGEVLEAGINSGSFSSGNKSGLNSNQHSFWGF